MEHTAHVEILSGIVRVFAPGKKYGDPYDWAVTVRWVSPDTVEYLGALRSPTRHEIRAMCRELCKLGVVYVLMKRLRPDGTEHVGKVNISKKGLT